MQARQNQTRQKWNWKQMRRAVRRPFEAAGYIFLKWTVPLWPRWAVVGFSQNLAKISILFPIREREVGMKNLNAVFGDTKTEQEKREILITSMATFTQTMLDVFWFTKNTHHRIPKYVEMVDSPLMRAFYDDQAIISITAHLGSWEVLGQAMALRGADLASIAATVKNKTVNRILINQRQKTGQTIIPQKGALKTLIARLRKKGKTAFVLDQNTDPKDGGILVDFLGLPMSVSPAPAALAYRTATPIFFGFSIPQPGGKYRIEITDALEPPAFDKNADMDEVVLNLTQAIEDRISEMIRKYPQFWLWSYKHWRKLPGHAYPPNYPEY